MGAHSTSHLCLVSQNGFLDGDCHQRMHPMSSRHPQQPTGAISNDLTASQSLQTYLGLYLVERKSQFLNACAPSGLRFAYFSGTRPPIPTVILAMDKLFAIHGIPDVIRTNNRPPFNSGTYGFKTQKVTTLWPEANSQAESCMKCLGKVICNAHIENKDWKI